MAQQKKYSKKKYFSVYTLIFSAMALVVFMPFILNGKSLIWTGQEQDGLYQHYTALAYFGSWARKALHAVFIEHSLGSIPLWDFSIGCGADIITTLHYYVIGDPLTLLSVFVPEKYTEILYNFLIIFRLYASGLAFSCLCLKKQKSTKAVLAGALSYVFCGYCLYAAVRHPYFANPMIYFPLLAIGAEKIIKKQSPVLFIFMVFISAVSNFYFFYMLVIAVIFYVAVRFFTVRHENILSDFCSLFIRFALCGVLGTAMAGGILVPVVLLIKEGGRSAIELAHPILYNFSYYERLISSFITVGSAGWWSVIGLTAPAMLCVFILFGTKNKYKGLKIAFIILTLMFFIPSAGSIMNGMSYVTNRWCWLYSALVSYIVAVSWDNLGMLSRTQKRICVFASGIYFILLIFMKNGAQENTFASLCILFAAVILILLSDKPEMKYGRMTVSSAMLILVMLNICINSQYQYDERQDSYISQFLDAGQAYKSVTENSACAVSEVSDDNGGFFRYEQADKTEKNTGMLTGQYGTGGFWSLGNGYITQFLREMGLNEWQPQNYSGCDRRTFLDTLAAVKYFVSPVSYKKEIENTQPVEYIPFGFYEQKTVNTNRMEIAELEKRYARELGKSSLNNKEKSVLSDFIKRYAVYKNAYQTGIGMTYSGYITRNEYDSMTPSQRQEALLQGVLIESDKDIPNTISSSKPKYTQKSLDYTAEFSDGAELLTDGSFYVSRAGASVSLKFDSVSYCELYLQAVGMKAQAVSAFDQYHDGEPKQTPQTVYDALPKIQKNHLKRSMRQTDDWMNNKFDLTVEAYGSSNTLSYSTPYYQWTTGQKDYLVNLGFSKSQRKTIRIVFPQSGIYNFDKLEVIAQPMNSYRKNLAEIQKDMPENVKIGTNTVSCDISLNKPKILLLSVPYDKGFTAYVDGKKTPLIQADTMYTALPLPEGRHTIRLEYRTYGLKAGTAVSIAAFIAFVIVMAYIHRKNKNDISQIL